jgi:hypothetical protein
MRSEMPERCGRKPGEGGGELLDPHQPFLGFTRIQIEPIRHLPLLPKMHKPKFQKKKKKMHKPRAQESFRLKSKNKNKQCQCNTETKSELYV